VRVLSVNAGSSSLKLRLLDHDDRVLGSADLAMPGDEVDADAFDRALSGMPAPDAVGHRVVHGGEAFRRPVKISPGVERELRALTDLAPLHQPKSLAAFDAATEVLPDVPAVACFDTAFHLTLPAAASTYALPKEWRERYGLRRYGFHGLSHAYAARRAAEMLDRPDLRLVTCHLGAGASLAAVRGSESIDTTMGFTPLEGLVMATRSGSVDPGMLLWLLERHSVSEREMAEALEHSSGLLALAGSADMQHVLDRADTGDEDARLARDVYVHRLRAEMAAMAAALGGIDAVVFTGGVGENSREVRALALQGLELLAIDLDPKLNSDDSGDRTISTRASTVAALVIRSREDLEIAAQVRELLVG
jgi:acetate kinase